MGIWGQQVGDSFGRFFVSRKQDQLLASIDPPSLRYTYAGPRGGIIITNTAAVLCKPFGRDRGIGLQDIRSVKVTRGNFPMFMVRFLTVSYEERGQMLRYQIGIDKSNGKKALAAFREATRDASAPLVAEYSFGFDRMLAGVTVLFAATFLLMAFAAGTGPQLALIFGAGIAALYFLLGLFS